MSAPNSPHLKRGLTLAVAVLLAIGAALFIAPSARADTNDLRAEADRLMNLDYLSFLEHKDSVVLPAALDWRDNGCSGPWGIKETYKRLFDGPCQQHDFGYRNYGSDSGGLSFSPTEDTRAYIDGRFIEEMRRLCDDNFDAWWQKANKLTCYSQAGQVFSVVRHAGRSYFH